MIDNKYVQDGEERILSIYCNALGFGFVFMKNPLEVIEKGMVSVTPIDNTVIFQKIKHLVRKLKPERIVIEDFRGTSSNKSKRVIELLKKIQSFAKRKGVVLSAYSREQIKLVFRNWFAETRYEIAEVISRNVEAFSNLLFDKPKYPKTEHFRSAQFDAASLGITHYYLSQ